MSPTILITLVMITIILSIVLLVVLISKDNDAWAAVEV